MPPNKGMELTVKSDTPFAKRRAMGAPLLPAALPGVRPLKIKVHYNRRVTL